LQSYAAVKFKWPSDTANCNWYRSEQNLKVFWNAHILDCWHLTLDAKPDLLHYFGGLELLPSPNELMEKARTLVDRYTSETAICYALDLSFYTTFPDELNPQSGSTWSPPSTSNSDGEETFAGD
jgi:hypothetical protein